MRHINKMADTGYKSLGAIQDANTALTATYAGGEGPSPEIKSQANSVFSNTGLTVPTPISSQSLSSNPPVNLPSNSTPNLAASAVIASSQQNVADTAAEKLKQEQ